MRTVLLLIFLLFTCNFAYSASYDQYSDTVQTLFNRLEENIGVEENPNIEDTDNLEKENHQTDEHIIEPDKEEMEEINEEDEVIRIKPLPGSFKGSILDRIQSESTVSLKNMIDGVDKISTTFYNFITKGLIGLSPILLIIGAVLVLFSRGRAIGAILFVGVGLFVIFNAPELMQAFLSFITSIFN